MSAIPVTGVSSKSRQRSRARRKSKVGSIFFGRLTAFGIAACSTYIVSSMAGQVMVEKARLESIRATDRALLARKVVGEINNRLDEMTGLNAVGEWAKAHNFYSAEELAAPATLGGPKPAVQAPSAQADAAPSALAAAPGGEHAHRKLRHRRIAPKLPADGQDEADAQSR